MNARGAGIVSVAIHVALGLTFVHSGAAAWLWERVERDVGWRTGPTAVGTLSYFAIYWGAWTILSFCHPEIIRRIWRPETSNADHSAYLRMTHVVAHAGRALVASCIVLAIQVLLPAVWLAGALATLLLAMLVNACIVRESVRRTMTAWARSGAGLALATLLIHPWFVGQPQFVVRLAVVMTVWDWLGERVGVSRRLTRLVPSLYSGSGCIADHERVAR